MPYVIGYMLYAVCYTLYVIGYTLKVILYMLCIMHYALCIICYRLYTFYLICISACHCGGDGGRRTMSCKFFIIGLFISQYVNKESQSKSPKLSMRRKRPRRMMRPPILLTPSLQEI